MGGAKDRIGLGLIGPGGDLGGKGGGRRRRGYPGDGRAGDNLVKGEIAEVDGGGHETGLFPETG